MTSHRWCRGVGHTDLVATRERLPWFSRDSLHLPVFASSFHYLPLASGMAWKNTFPPFATQGT